jgi:hypothetical protein
MTRFARLFLVLTLALSLPFHAAYGVGMAQCLALQAAVAADPSVHAGHGALEAHVPGATSDHAQHAYGQAEQGQETAHGDGGTGPHCGTCTACCTSVVISGSASLALSAGAYIDLAPLPEQRLNSFKPSRLDRPPLVS